MKIELVEKQKEFVDEVLAGNSIFLTGKAGTGKSFVVNWLIEELKKKGKKVAALAPTGIAANNIKGQTIHSFFQISPFGILDFESCSYLKSEKVRMIRLIDVIFIDEISMARADLLDAINWTLIKNGCKKLHEIQLVFIGDMKQLKPVADDNMKAVITREYDGVDYHKRTKKWRARIVYNKKLIHLGLFESELLASNAYEDKLKEINT